MTEVLLLGAFVLLSGFFSGAEIALFSIGPEKIQALKNATESLKRRQKILQLEALKKDPQKLLVTILIGNNVVNVAASSIATMLALDIAAQMDLGDQTTLVVGAVTAVMTFLILLFGEITPKSLAHKHAVRFALIVTPVLSTLQFLLWPIVYPLSRFVQSVSGDQDEHGLNEDELKAALELSEREGKINHSERQWIDKVLDFGEHTVESVMTPRSKVFGLENTTSVRQAIQAVQSERYSRIPIYQQDLDQIIGVLSIHALVEKSLEADYMNLNVANLSLKSPLKVPRTIKIDTMLETFRQEKVHMALVCDEHGGFMGVVTLEDVLEEIFGEIQDELDEEVLEIQQNGRWSLTCAGDTEVEAIEAFICDQFPDWSDEARFPWTLEDENKSISLFLLEKLQRFPEVGETWSERKNDLRFTLKILAMQDERIEQVEVRVK